MKRFYENELFSEGEKGDIYIIGEILGGKSKHLKIN